MHDPYLTEQQQKQIEPRVIARAIDQEQPQELILASVLLALSASYALIYSIV